MEAMAAGLLVIGSEVGGQLEMLHNGRTGLTYQAGDAEGLADCIEHAASEPELRRRLAKSGQEMILERFTLTRMGDDVESWLKGIIL
jgi:glycosyltransferase involved in cell wall biosynthesis